ncbi:MAG: CBS domain-containing protein [Actinomycetota bacterium]|nr:CBS domain-containing protein [Actinomycetota bacterium]
MLVRDIMTTPVASVGEHTSCVEALAVLAVRRLTALPVTDSGGAVIGLLSEVDLLRSALEADPRSHLGPTQTHGEPLPPVVADLMTRSPVTVDEGGDVAELAHLFVRTSFKSFPVVRDGLLVGVVSRSDVVRAIARPQDVVLAEVRAVLAELGSSGWEATIAQGEVLVTGPATAREQDLATHLAASVLGVRAVRVVPAAADPTSPPTPGGAAS